jgi:hypothetical protein
VPRPGETRVSHCIPNLFWVRRDLWEARSFEPKDCFLVKETDVLRSDLKQLFSLRISGAKERSVHSLMS